MKKLILFLFCISTMLPLLSFAGKPGIRNPDPGDGSATVPDGLFSAAQADTFWLASYTFDSGGSCAAQGWSTHDLTAQPGTMWHVDTYNVVTGLHSMWMGARASASEPWCSYANLPGYGNGWNQTLTSKVWTGVTAPVVMDYKATYDSEPGYDYTYFQYFDGTAWVDLESYTGGELDTTVVNLAVPTYGTTNVRVRYWFESDGAWSDEDGLWNTNGAFILDDMSLDDAVGNLDTENWEGEAVNATKSDDNDWIGAAGLGYGDFAGLFPGVSVLQQDKCTQDITCLWGFFKNSTDDYSCATPVPHPGQAVVPYENALGQFISNEIWSPWIDLTGGGAVPAGSSSWLDFYVYKDLPLHNLVFFTWRVRSRSGLAGCPTDWRDHGYIYYGGHKFWLRFNESIGDLIAPGYTQIQIALGVVDMCGIWCPKYGNGDCHSHAPLFDRVKLISVNTVGPQWGVRHIDLFQDNFSEDGTITGTARADMAQDILPQWNPSILPGDSIVFNVSEPSVGLGAGGDNGRADVYCYVKSNFMGVGLPANWEAPEAGMWGYNAVRYPYMGGGATAGGFYKFQCDSSYQDAAQTNPTVYKFAFDLNDAYFTPPARIDYYFAAKDANGVTSYWSRFTGHTLVQAEAESWPMEFQCLPTGESDILYVDGADDREGPAQIYFDSAFELLGILPDRYDILEPTALGGNSLGARASFAQITNCYQKIIWNTGNREKGLVGDGTGSPSKSQDAQLLYNFLDQTTVWNPGVYLSGDVVAGEMKALNTAPFQQLFNFINYNVLSGNHVAAGLAISPLAIGSTVGLPAAGYIFQHAGVPDTLVAYGGCPVINDFDVLQAAGLSVEAMEYNPALTGAVLTQQRVNSHARTARFVLSGFGFNNIHDDRVQFPPDRVDHMVHIIRWFENAIDDPTGNDPPMVYSNYLANNYPNPFNPVTTIKYGVKERAHVSLKIFNVAGQLVKSLVDEVQPPAAVYAAQWKGDNNRGEAVASGVYFYRLVTKNFSQTRKMVLLK